MRFGPPVGFARRPDGHKLAYQVLRDAELDLVFVSGYAPHLGLLWEDPSVAGFLHKLAAFSRLILLDRLGSGLSDRGPSGQSFEDDLDDVRLVMDTVGSKRTAFFGSHLAGGWRCCSPPPAPNGPARWSPTPRIRPACATRTFPGAPARRHASGS
jgi:pimeloyl-ACP methyl ester carboxylesterase